MKKCVHVYKWCCFFLSEVHCLHTFNITVGIKAHFPFRWWLWPTAFLCMMIWCNLCTLNTTSCALSNTLRVQFAHYSKKEKITLHYISDQAHSEVTIFLTSSNPHHDLKCRKTAWYCSLNAIFRLIQGWKVTVNLLKYCTWLRFWGTSTLSISIFATLYIYSTTFWIFFFFCIFF